MRIFKSYNFLLLPNNIQKTKFLEHCGAARWAYNWALAKKQKYFYEGKMHPNFMELHKELVKIKGTDELPWAYSVSESTFQVALKNCDQAFNHFFRKYNKNSKKRIGYPKFKSKKDSDQSFHVRRRIRIIKNTHIRLPKIGKIKLGQKNFMSANSKILSAKIYKKIDRWFISVNVEEEYISKLKNNKKIIGIDLGLRNLATCSNGCVLKNPKLLAKNINRLKLLHRKFSRAKKGSNNRSKIKLRLQKLYFRISNQRKDIIHKFTSKIINENQVIILEDLNIKNMIEKNKFLAKHILDAGMFELKRQIEYKSKWNDRKLIIVDRFYPSSKICSNCGNIKDDLKIHHRIYKCNICNNVIDRDLNAAKNLYTVGSTEFYASGENTLLFS